jgi:hypothetical protein
MLRDAVSALAGFTTWPCDEVNYLWRHGNLRTPHDELAPEQATPRIRRYVSRRFARRSRRGEHVVEKTCANSLRVAFVDRVLPEAKFVWIVRDGRDAVPSARRRWHAKLDLGYAAAKARFIPPSDLPYCAARHFARRVHRLRSADGQVASWGPRLRDMDALVASRPPLEVCALQWRRCVEQAAGDLAMLDSARVHRIRYEDFVAEPATHLADIAAFAGRPAHDDDVCAAVSHVVPEKAAAPRALLSDEEYAELEALMAPALAAHGYG